jgi:hypothetical protein
MKRTKGKENDSDLRVEATPASYFFLGGATGTKNEAQMCREGKNT